MNRRKRIGEAWIVCLICSESWVVFPDPASDPDRLPSLPACPDCGKAFCKRCAPKHQEDGFCTEKQQ